MNNETLMLVSMVALCLAHLAVLVVVSKSFMKTNSNLTEIVGGYDERSRLQHDRVMERAVERMAVMGDAKSSVQIAGLHARETDSALNAQTRIAKQNKAAMQDAKLDAQARQMGTEQARNEKDAY